VAAVQQAIQRLTQQLCGADHGFAADDNIVIELTDTSLPDLTVIDLPGIVRTVTAGQDASVIDQVRCERLL
jgi:hypothetical protein